MLNLLQLRATKHDVNLTLTDSGCRADERRASGLSEYAAPPPDAEAPSEGRVKPRLGSRASSSWKVLQSSEQSDSGGRFRHRQTESAG